MSREAVAALVFVAPLGLWAAWQVMRACRGWRQRSRGKHLASRQTGAPPPSAESLARIVPVSTQGPRVPNSAEVAMIRKWVRDRACASCGGALDTSERSGRHVALQTMEGFIRPWTNLAPDDVPLALITDVPVCWNCYVADRFRREHPDLVTDREPAATHVL